MAMRVDYIFDGQSVRLRLFNELAALARWIDKQAFPGFFVSDQVTENIKIAHFILSD